MDGAIAFPSTGHKLSSARTRGLQGPRHRIPSCLRLPPLRVGLVAPSDRETWENGPCDLEDTKYTEYLEGGVLLLSLPAERLSGTKSSKRSRGVVLSGTKTDALRYR